MTTEKINHTPQFDDILAPNDPYNSYEYGCCLPFKCPECNDDYLHQGDVRVINRHEDSDGVATHISTDNHIVQAHVDSEDIVGRRDTIEIDYDCENCGLHTLQLHQHKGRSLIKWIR